MDSSTAFGEALMRALLLVGGTLQSRVALTRLALGRAGPDCLEKLSSAERQIGITGFNTTIAPRIKSAAINTAIEVAYEKNVDIRKKLDM
jgi:hypothetical protein